MPARLFAGDPSGARGEALAATLSSLDSVLAEPIADCIMRDREGRLCIDARSPADLEAELRIRLPHLFEMTQRRDAEIHMLMPLRHAQRNALIELLFG